MTLILTDEQKVTLSIQPLTQAGNPAKVDGKPVWSVSNPELISISESEDGLSVVASTVGPLGSAQVSVSADADLGEGVRELFSILDVEVIAAEAVSLGIVAGTPEPK